MEDKILLEHKIFQQNEWVSIYKTCRVNNLVYNSGDFVIYNSSIKKNDIEMTQPDFKTRPTGECLCIRGFVSEANQVYVLLQDVISNEELVLKQIANSNLLDSNSSRFFFGNTLDSLLLKDFCKNYKKLSKNASVSSKLFVDLEKKCIAQGSTYACLDSLRAHVLTNHNISFYHTVYKRCTAHVIGLITDDVDNGPILFIRYFYRYDEPEVENADTEDKILDKALKGKQYFKRIPRLWSNHFAVVRVPKWNVENIKYCVPKKLKPTNVCCILTFLFPQRKILELPSYLLQLQQLIPSKPDIPSPPNKNEPTYLDDIMDSDDEGDDTTVSQSRHKRKTSSSDLSYEEEQKSLHGYKLRKRSSDSSDDEEIAGSRTGSIMSIGGSNSVDGFDEDNASVISSSSIGTILNDAMDTVSISSGCVSPNKTHPSPPPPPQLQYNPAFYTPFMLPSLSQVPSMQQQQQFQQQNNKPLQQYNIPVNNDMVMLNSIGSSGSFFTHKSNVALTSTTTTTTTLSTANNSTAPRNSHNHSSNNLSEKEKSDYTTKLESLIKALIFYAPPEIVDDISSIKASI